MVWACCYQNIVGFLVFCMCFWDLTQTKMSSMWNSVLWQSACCFAVLQSFLICWQNSYCGKRDKDRRKQLRAAFAQQMIMQITEMEYRTSLFPVFGQSRRAQSAQTLGRMVISLDSLLKKNNNRCACDNGQNNNSEMNAWSNTAILLSFFNDGIY